LLARREQPEERGEDGSRPLLGVAEERPRPAAGPDPVDREIAELRVELLDTGRHQVHEGAALEAERRPVELLVGDEARMLVAARAGETDAEDGRMRCPGQAVELAEGRQLHARLAPRGAGEGVAR